LALCVEYRIKPSKASNFRSRNYRAFPVSYKPINRREVSNPRFVVTCKGWLLITVAKPEMAQGVLRRRGPFGYNSAYSRNTASTET